MDVNAVKSRRIGYKKNPVLVNPYNVAYILLFILLSAGVIIGSIVANNMDSALLAGISKSIEAGFSGMALGAAKSDVFKESMFKYSRTIILVWVLIFIWAGVFVQALIIVFKGYSIGYMVSVFIMKFGEKGLLLSAGSFLLQNICMVLMCMFIAYPGLTLAVEKALKQKGQGKKTSKEGQPFGLLERVIILLICLFLAMLIALYEAYICPEICEILR